jgi:hypothetical protein
MADPVVTIPPYYITIASLQRDIGNVSLKSATLINEVTCNPIITTYPDFKTLFYSTDGFSIPSTLRNTPTTFEKVKFDTLVLPSGKKLYLLEEIYQNIESSLSISRASLSDTTVFNLNQTIGNIVSLVDIVSITNSITNSLNWTSIYNIIKNYYLDQALSLGLLTPIEGEAYLSISVIFISSSNVAIKPVNIKFTYKVIIPFNV